LFVFGDDGKTKDFVCCVNVCEGASMNINAPSQESTCGLLGNNNGDQEDDFKSKSGTIIGLNKEEKINAMGDSWMVKIDNEPLRCTLYPTTSYSSLSQCNFDQTSVEQSCKLMLTKQFKVSVLSFSLSQQNKKCTE
jgi:hypothetical protein